MTCSLINVLMKKMSLSRATRTLENERDKEMHERRKKYARRKSFDNQMFQFSRRNSLNGYYEYSKHFNFIGIFSTGLDTPDVRSHFIRKVISGLKSIPHQQPLPQVKIAFDEGFVMIDSFEKKDCIHMKYALKNVCDFGLNSTLTRSVLFFVVLDALRPVALCHVLVADEAIDLQRMYRCFYDRLYLRQPQALKTGKSASCE